jgi:cysteine desulfurase/selenocysteine lyase
VDEITPDLIARIASRIYNEAPQADGAPIPGASGAATPKAAASGTHAPDFVLPEPTATPAAMSTHLGSLPFSVGSWPHAAAPAGMSSPSPPAAPDFSALPTFAGAPSAGSSSPAGLQGFVAKIRQTHFSGRSQSVDPSALNLRQRLASGPTGAQAGSRPLDVPAIREDFPILRQRVHGKPLAWLDNAATTQKPQSVIDAISHFYEQDNSNIHRAAHTLAARATDAYEGARQKVQTFLGASSVKEIVFVRGTTEGINLVTQTYGRKFLQPGDEVVLSVLEHHANIVPWQMVAKEKGAILRVIPVNDRGEVMLEEYQRILGPRTKVVALTQASNSLGTILPVAEMTQMAKRYGARVLIDGAQSVAHIPVNLQQLGCDFFVFSGHKIFGPTGIGVVYIKEELHDVLPPWQGGGNMIRNVTFEETTFADVPGRLEAGTPNIADAVGLGAALDYVNRLGLPNIAAYEHELLQYATDGLSGISGLRLIGTAREKVGVLSFVLPNRRTEDIGRLLDQEGIAVRAGHHCSQPSLRRFGVETTVRPSLTFYNTTGEIDRLVDAVRRIQRLP